MLRFLYILFIFFGIQISLAQPEESLQIDNPYNIHYYTLKDGLSQVSINDIIEDQNGFIWVATQAGLNRFDGTFFKSYYNDPKNPNSLSGNFINILFADKNKIWIGTRSNGLCYLDTENNRFFNFVKLKNHEILDIVKDPYNNIFVSVSDKGIAIINKGKNQLYSVGFMDFFVKKNVNPTKIFISNSKTLWIGTKEGRLFYGKLNKNPSEISFFEFPLGQKFEKINVINSNSGNYIWVGTDHKLFQIDIETHLILPISFNKLRKKASTIVYDLEWKNGFLWIATGEGLFQYDSENYQLIRSFYHNELSQNTLSNNSINTLFTDSYNQLWLGTGKYLNLFYKNEFFHNIIHDAGNSNSLNSNIIFSTFKDKHDLWVGTSGGGINLLRDHKFYHFTKSSHQLPSNVCFTLLPDSDDLWAGTKEGLVILTDYKKNYSQITTKIILHNQQVFSSLGNNFVRHLYKDSKENIWICTDGGGLDLFTGNIKDNIFSFKHFTHQFGNKRSISSDKVKFITQIDPYLYWVGTNKGLNILSFKDDHFSKPEFNRLRIKDSVVLTNDVIYNILKDKDSGVWIGTTGGIYFYNFKNNQLKLIKQHNNLNNNVIYGLLEDHQNNIWYSTNKGLSHYHRITGIFTNYNQSDGISSAEFDLNACYKDSSGLLYFGGINGITFFDPKKVNDVSKESKLYIDNIQITNIEKNAIEKIHIKNGTNLEIKASQFPFYVNFSEIDLNYYKNTEFAYRLKPDDKRWNMIQSKHQIQFLNLASGSYLLEIQGITKGKLWKNQSPLTLSITVIPLWWQSNMAYFLYLILLLLILFSIYYYTLKRKLEHQENLRLQELDKVKTKLYGNITHELRTPLTVIMGMTENIRQIIKPEDLDQLKTKFNILTRNTRKLLFLINQMLDLSKIESGKLELRPVLTDIVPFIKANLESFRSLAANKHIELFFYNEKESIIMDFDPEKISVIMSNLISNAVKFTPEHGKIILHLKESTINNKLFCVLKIKDNGIGIEDEDLNHIFDRFYQVDNTFTGGTGIGLSLTKELVQLMNGSIAVNSKPNQGTEFIIKLPITTLSQKPKEISYYPLQLADEIKEENRENMETIQLDDYPQILIIEDNKDIAHYIASGLTNLFEIHFAEDGKEGVDKAFEKIPDLVITDLMMPELDGFEVCKVLKNDERTSHIPVIMLTAKTFEKDKIKGLAYGADAYLTKPFNQKELLIRIEQLILIRKKIREKFKRSSFNDLRGSSKETDFIQKCVEIIHKNLDDNEFHSSNLAFAINLSESQLYRKLKATTNFSTGIFIREVRLDTAKEMLERTEKNISEIAYSCGFSSPGWFSKIFKEKYGVSPKFFRQNRI